MTYFLPTIIKGFKYSPIKTQLHSVPPFAAAYALSLVLSFASDRLKHRFSFVFLPVLLAIAGVGTLLNVHDNVHVQYAAVFLVTMGVFAALPIAICWYIMNLRNQFERALGTAWMIGFGNFGGIIATFSFVAVDAPYYHKGYGIVMMGLCLMGAASIAYAAGLVTENRRQARKVEDGEVVVRYML